MASRFEVFEDVDGSWRYRLIAKNGEILAASESYRDATDARRGVTALRRAALTTWTVEVAQ
jgi:uncharacterized protein YegP (UPF0339 family)